MKILVADDELVSRKKLEQIVTQIGDCVATETGGEAITAFEHAWEGGLPFDVIFLDISMPDMSGIDVLKNIRQIEADKGITRARRARVLMVTSHSDQKIVVSSLEAGCDNFIVKPFNKESVLEKLNNIGFAVG